MSNNDNNIDQKDQVGQVDQSGQADREAGAINGVPTDRIGEIVKQERWKAWKMILIILCITFALLISLFIVNRIRMERLCIKITQLEAEVSKYNNELIRVPAVQAGPITVTTYWGDGTFSWLEVFDSAAEADHYFTVLAESLALYGASVFSHTDPYELSEAFPLVWEMSVTVPAAKHELEQGIQEVLRGLGAWDDIRDTSESWGLPRDPGPAILG